MTHIGRTIRRLRRARSWRQIDLAKRAGYAKSTVEQIEGGRKEPLWPTVIALAGALGMKASELVAAWESDNAPVAANEGAAERAA